MREAYENYREAFDQYLNHFYSGLNALAMLTGRLPKLSSFRVIEARRIEIRGRPGEPLQGDGDIIGELDVAIEVLPNALDLIYPALQDSGMASAT